MVFDACSVILCHGRLGLQFRNTLSSSWVMTARLIDHGSAELAGTTDFDETSLELVHDKMSLVVHILF